MSQLIPFLRTALLGTQREPLPEMPAGTPLANLMASLDGVEPEAMLLSVAGAVRLGELAGQLPCSDHATKGASPPPATDLPPCGAGSRNRLRAMLDGRFPG